MCYTRNAGGSNLGGHREVGSLLRGGLGATPQLFWGNFCAHFWHFFGTCFFIDGFLIPVKELGLLNNPGQWIMGLYSMGSYMYIVF
jgi:hypothetical protein